MPQTNLKQVFDQTVKPQDDFFGYVNNDWLSKNPIPPSESSWGTFYVLRDQAWGALRDIVDELTAKPAGELSHDQKLLADFFAGSTDYSQNQDNNLAVMQQEINLVDDIKSANDLPKYLGQAHRRGFNQLWDSYVDLDDHNSGIQVLRLHQSGLTLPNRDYYLDDSEKMTEIRAKYQEHCTRVEDYLRSNSSLKSSLEFQKVFDIERTIANISRTDIELRDVHKNYNHFTLDELREKYSDFDWNVYFERLLVETPRRGVSTRAQNHKDAINRVSTKMQNNIIINQPEFLEKVFELISQKPLDDIKMYLKWQVINSCLPKVSEQATRLAFDFFGKALSGQTEQKPLWKRSILQLDSLIIGEILGREYAARYFPESSKQAVLDIVEEIRKAYHIRIDKLTWMSDKTKRRAHTKLDNIKVLAGYPSIWKEFSKLEFDSKNHLENVLKAREFETDHELAKVGQPPANEEWHMNAHTVNAYHNPNRLEIVFPAAILQPPFYNPNASHATNLGAIGAVIGHEFTHGFDDQGSEFNEFGILEKWQTPEEQEDFKKLAQNIVDQANDFEVLPGTFLQGELILGEAIADVGGLELAIEALKLSENPSDSNKSLDELFLAFATAERGHTTEQRAIELAKLDPHPPSRFRVNCVVSHVDDFYGHFGVRSSDKLYLPEDKRAKIW